jgi:hypothetical protein
MTHTHEVVLSPKDEPELMALIAELTPSPQRTFIDDRTEEQKKTHVLAVVGTDTFMSGWGGAEGGKSYAGWACRPEDLWPTERRVRARGDMHRVRVVSLRDYRPQAAHTHIYVHREE